MPHTILAPMNDFPAQAGVLGIVAKLRRATRIEIPIGYQDKTGFHMGVKPAEKTGQVVAGLIMALNDCSGLSQELKQKKNSRICGNNSLAYPVGIGVSAIQKTFGVAREHSQ
jgi:hypothetical protein